MKYVPFLLLLFCFRAQAQVDVQRYSFELTLSDKSDRIEGEATIELKLRQPVQQFTLDLVGQKKGGKGMKVLSVDGDLMETFTHTGDRLQVQLFEAADTGLTYTYTIQYAGIPSDGLIISRNKYGDRTFFSDNWPDRARHWLPTNDRPDDKAAVRFSVFAPAHYTVISNGQFGFEESWEDNKNTVWEETVPIPTKVMVIGAARFAVAQVDSNYSVPVTAWVYPQDSAKGVYDYSLADDILQFFTSYIGPYAFGKLANVQSKTIFGGMENASAIFYAENSVKGDRSSEGLIAHEIAHQWFGNMATEKSFAHLWLSEGFATYMTLVYMEQKYGTDTLMAELRKDRDQVAAFARTRNQPVVDTVSDYMSLLNANSYQKGGWVLHLLRRRLGDSAFHRVVRTYYARYAGRNADTRDFQQVAEEVSGQQLGAFFDQWLYRPGIPLLDIRWKQDGDQVKVQVRQRNQQPFSFPFEIGLLTESGTLVPFKMQIEKGEEGFNFTLPAKAKQLIADPFVNALFDAKVVEEK